MGENYIYTRPNLIIRALVRAGLFGRTHYGEGEYIHELKGLNQDTPWRRTWQTGVNGITYGTHSLGPILQWMPGDRVAAVTCAGSGHHWRDLDGRPFEAEDTCVMLAKMVSGGLVKIRVDMISDRPHAPTNYMLQGTDGCYESARAPDAPDRLWLRSRSGHVNDWLDLRTLEDEFLPDTARQVPEALRAEGHHGGDFLEVAAFLRAVIDGQPPEIGLHEAMDMTLPGLISQHAIARQSQWLPVPDSRAW
jgi:predicted dehydrogenase